MDHALDATITRVVTRIAWDVILPRPMAERDEEIIHAVLGGNVDRYAELVDTYQGQALRVAFSVLGNLEDAQDAAQEAFVRAYRALARFHGGSAFSTWLYRIVVNACRDTYRRRARQPVVVASVGEPESRADDGTLFVDVNDPSADPSDQVAQRELSHRLSGTIRALPMKQRTAFVLHHVHGLTLEEVSAVMRCRVGTVKSHIFRATGQLRRQLAPWLAQEAL